MQGLSFCFIIRSVGRRRRLQTRTTIVLTRSTQFGRGPLRQEDRNLSRSADFGGKSSSQVGDNNDEMQRPDKLEDESSETRKPVSPGTAIRGARHNIGLWPPAVVRLNA